MHANKTRFGAKILAIDPGLEGALASFDFENTLIGAADLPRFERKRLNAVSIAGIVAELSPQYFVIEDVGPMPKQGVVSVFTFGFACGIISGIACANGSSVHYVRPASWKSHFRLTKRPKDAARECAIRLYPNAAPFLTRKRDHGRADAILIGRYFLDREAQGEFV